MSKILIVGNVLKDIYLRLDERNEAIEEDGDGVKWLNLGFNESEHRFFGRKSVYSGAVVTLEVVGKFEIEAEIPGWTDIFETEKLEDEMLSPNYRYILSAGGQISYLAPAERVPTKFEAPKDSDGFDWIFVDRSATIDGKLVADLFSYLEKHEEVRLAVYAPKYVNKVILKLLARAEIVFTDSALPRFKGRVCRISETGAKLGKSRVRFRGLKKTALYTHLTTYSIIAGAVLSALIIGKNDKEALMLAKMDIENSKLEGTLPAEELEKLAEEEEASAVNLRQMARELVGNGKGILAADESGGSIHKKFESMNIPDDFEHRRDYRNLFFTTPDLEKYVNGVILFDETARQLADNGEDFVKFLTSRGIIPGIKVDKGLANMPGSTEKYTLGLSGLPERLEEYYEMGLRFAKWRAAFEITENAPTKNVILKNAEILAQYALDCQEARIVPIVEPEVVFDGDFPVEKCAEVTGAILKALFEALEAKQVDLMATILKVNMVLAGKQYKEQSTPREVGEWTAKVLKKYVPETLAGVVFLSGGQTPEQATENLQEVIKNGPFPWPVTFSYARALQGPALEAWKGDNKNYPEAKEAFKERLIANCKALTRG